MEPQREALINEHLSLVDHVVRRTAGSFPSHIERQELLAAGRLGLTEAALRYDFDRAVPFAPFAARRIRGAVLDLMRSQDWVPRKVRDTAREAALTSGSLERRLGRTPDDGEVASAMGIEVDELRSSRLATRHGRIGTLHPVDADDGPVELSDPTQMTIEELLEHRELKGYVRAAVDSLPERLRLIVVGHYLEGRSLDELGAFLQLTPSRISQLKADAIEIIRHGIDAQFGPTTGSNDQAPKGRVAIRQARYAAAIAEHATWKARLASAPSHSTGLARPAQVTDRTA